MSVVRFLFFVVEGVIGSTVFGSGCFCSCIFATGSCLVDTAVTGATSYTHHYN
jgi:hypothetical protein